jgi:hypothetical protein
MPTVIRTGRFNLPAGGAAWQFSMNDMDVVIYNTKLDKHTIGTGWPQAEQGRHTGIIASDQKAEIQLYEQFASDFEFEFQRLGGTPVWIELEYEEKELKAQVWGADVVDQKTFQFSKLRVGASITANGAGCIVHINHGPYPVDSL